MILGLKLEEAIRVATLEQLRLSIVNIQIWVVQSIVIIRLVKEIEIFKNIFLKAITK